LVHPLSVNNVKCVRYLLEAEIIKPSVHSDLIESALNCAITYQNTEAIKVLMDGKNRSKTKTKLATNVMKQIKERNKSMEMLSYLKKRGDNEYSQIMNGLCETMQLMIEENKPICKSLLNLCWLHDKDKLWSTLLHKCERIFSGGPKGETLSWLDWKWIEENVIDDDKETLLMWMEETDEH
ncbi:hypothetical protein RFI_35253, partial [Reticulomyxa filosa]